MTKVITEKDIMHYIGMKTVVLPAGTLLTPSAKDWADEHGLDVVVGENNGMDQKAELLEQTIRAVLNNVDKSGGLLKREELVKIVVSSLERMGSLVENR